MAPRMQALARLQTQEQSRKCLMYLGVLVTIAVGGIDIGIVLLVKLRKFFEEQYVVFCRGGGPLTHKHFQMIVNGNFTSLLVLSKKIKVCLGWEVSRSL